MCTGTAGMCTGAAGIMYMCCRYV